jgi:hypothetical protein
MMPRKPNACTLVVVCLLVQVVINVIMMIRLAVDVRASASRILKESTLPCGAVPTRFIREEPECAGKLLRSVNVANVRILSSEALHTVGTPPAIQGWHNLSA